MTLEEIRYRKHELECKIRDSIDVQCSAFHAATGVRPRGVDVIFRDCARMSSPEPQFVIERVVIDCGRV